MCVVGGGGGLMYDSYMHVCGVEGVCIRLGNTLGNWEVHAHLGFCFLIYNSLND